MGGGRELIIAIDRKFWKWIFQRGKFYCWMKERERKGGIVIVIFEIRMNGQICIDLQRFCIRIFHKCFRLVDFARDEIINM